MVQKGPMRTARIIRVSALVQVKVEQGTHVFEITQGNMGGTVCVCN